MDSGSDSDSWTLVWTAIASILAWTAIAGILVGIAISATQAYVLLNICQTLPIT